jgi:hypothetical protein
MVAARRPGPWPRPRAGRFPDAPDIGHGRAVHVPVKRAAARAPGGHGRLQSGRSAGRGQGADGRSGSSSGTLRPCPGIPRSWSGGCAAGGRVADEIPDPGLMRVCAVTSSRLRIILRRTALSVKGTRRITVAAVAGCGAGRRSPRDRAAWQSLAVDVGPGRSRWAGGALKIARAKKEVQEVLWVEMRPLGLMTQAPRRGCRAWRRGGCDGLRWRPHACPADGRGLKSSASPANSLSAEDTAGACSPLRQGRLRQGVSLTFGQAAGWQLGQKAPRQQHVPRAARMIPEAGQVVVTAW